MSANYTGAKVIFKSKESQIYAQRMVNSFFPVYTRAIGASDKAAPDLVKSISNVRMKQRGEYGGDF